MVVPVQVVHDTDTGEPIIGSECGMCQICWDNLYDLMEEDALTDA